jgi:hypothetical protein
MAIKWIKKFKKYIKFIDIQINFHGNWHYQKRKKRIGNIVYNIGVQYCTSFKNSKKSPSLLSIILMSVLYQKGFMPTFSLTAKIAWGCRFNRKNCCWSCCFQLLTCVGSYILNFCSKWGSWKIILFWRIIFSWVTSVQIFPTPPSSHSKYNLYFSWSHSFKVCIPQRKAQILTKYSESHSNKT